MAARAGARRAFASALLRGQTGREWLPEQFRRIGSDVVVLSTYIRVPLELTVPQLHRLEKAILGPSPLIYLTSTDAVDVLMHAVRPVPNARMWITRGKAPHDSSARGVASS